MTFPSIKLKAIIMLLALFLSISLAHDHGNGYKCTHDEKEHPEPEQGDIEETGFPVTEESRLLASYNNIRMTGYYGLLSSKLQSYMQDSLGPAVLSYFQAALKVKYPVTSKITISSSTICSVTTPSILKSGVTTDYFIMWVDEYDEPASSTATTWVADSYACYLATGSKRPLVAKTMINSAVFSNPGTNLLLHEKNIYMIMHEMTHTLGFTSSLYNYFLDSNGKQLTGHVISETLDGSTSVVVNVEPLTTRLRSFFGCSTLAGAYMENSGSAATANSHFERRQFAFEAMTSGLIYQQSYSQFSLAMLEGSGWYVPDYTYADPYWFGQGEGCNFLTQSCSAKGFSFPEFCTGSSRGCTVPGRGGGSCSSDIRSDDCKFVHPDVNYDCDNTDASDYARLPTLQSFGRDAYSKCFEGTLSSTSTTTATSFCFKYNCTGSGINTKLQVTVGTKTLTCSEAGSMSVSGYKGYITCPDPLTFCNTVGAKVCPRNCMGRGSCVNGKCVCNSGFSGKDCAAI